MYPCIIAKFYRKKTKLLSPQTAYDNMDAPPPPPPRNISVVIGGPCRIIIPTVMKWAVHPGIAYNCERSELPSLFNARIFYIFIYIFIYIYIYIFQAVRRAVNEMFETPDTVFNNLELLVNPSSTAKKCSATEDCCRNPGGDRHPSSTVKYCSATGLLPNRQRGERPGVNGLPFSHRRKETPVFNKLQLLVNRRLRQNRRKRNKPVFNS